MSSYDKIRAKQIGLKDNTPDTRPYDELLHTIEHAPDIAMFGCFDARMPFATLGPEHGKALINRPPGAYVRPYAAGSQEAAFVAFALKKGVTDFIVMGHEDCGASKCCLNGHGYPETEGLEDVLGYMDTLGKEREMALKQRMPQKQERAMQEAIVSASLDNLEQYPGVKAAMDAGKIHLRGLLLDVHSALAIPPQPFLWELTDRAKGEFSLMAGAEPRRMRVTPSEGHEVSVERSLRA